MNSTDPAPVPSAERPDECTCTWNSADGRPHGVGCVAERTDAGTDEGLEELFSGFGFPRQAKALLMERIAQRDQRIAEAARAEGARSALLSAADDLEGRLGTDGAPKSLYDFRVWLRARAAALPNPKEKP